LLALPLPYDAATNSGRRSRWSVTCS